ncbi:MAG TPA: ABC transporter substrate-binding protein [Bacteroidia bacterium]|nr:ABC transporter substrate-binding protein [Bacteroidia bacterium]
MKLRFSSFAAISVSLIALLSGCSSGTPTQKKSQVVIWEISDPQTLLPITGTELMAEMITKYMFQQLVEVDFHTLEFVPALAESRPLIEKTPSGGMNVTFRIRKEAKWDNGTPVTAKDVEFTLKATMNPRVNNPAIKSTMDFISDLKLYPEDPLKLTFVCDTAYFMAEAGCGGFQIIPEYAYDPKGLMRGFTVSQVCKHGASIADDPKIQEFATDMNSEKRMRDKNFMSGSGPYKLDEWVPNQRLTLKKKENYWGDQFAEQMPFFGAYPEKLVFNTINDYSAAVVALKAGNLDVLYSIKPKDFVELKDNEAFKKKFNIYTPAMLAYYYIGMNTQSPLLRGTKTRQALSHIADVDKYIQTVYYGLAERIVGPVHPGMKKTYNSDIPLYKFDLDKAKQLLAEDGWKDSNGDGILDKVIDGKHTEFKVTMAINAGNELRKSIALMFQEDARKVGIEVNVVTQEWNTYIGNLKKHHSEMFISAWQQAPVPLDLKQVWHSSAAVENGDNYAAFVNHSCDSIIDAIRTELNEDKRNLLFKKLQVITHEAAPFIFLFSPTERIAVSRKFTNVVGSVMRPGFHACEFKLEESK